MQCTCIYDEWRVSPDTVLKEKMKYRSLCIVSSTNGEIMLIYARVCVCVCVCVCVWNSLVVQLVKNPPAMQKIWVRSVGWEDPLEKEMATHSTIAAWGIPWTV